mmetsp:Transcript_31994/g.83720  ORF Transcript_31994/g.83720 Transcript_31994/m.83720 type:complete len:140 (+) Transcript_31994:117-536(+)|eukprot:CAMPEP_0115850698 /NCGR_PEP_ID=MMETSP0287-20121206/12101_1 /TAXON_ID=412157 /ORGANISM="Chrysochromulina rotalis, Strain UIO044" /LENGTH=139 /DNA_ID=CAMNT_0003304709 /DNA_START=94 /DNA_END=513 /DNA_ORIENTATION=-
MPPQQKRMGAEMCHYRPHMSADSDSDDSDDECSARLHQATAAAAANRDAAKRRSQTEANVRTVRLDTACELVVENLEEEIMLAMLSALEHECQDEFRAAATEGRQEKVADSVGSPLLATPAMFSRFSALVANGTVPVRG